MPAIGGLGPATGNGAVGAAPERAKPRPAITTRRALPPPVRSAVVLPPAKAPAAAPTATTMPPITVRPTAGLPTLDQPPVPTPTEILEFPTDPADPSDWPSDEPWYFPEP
ncbi:hypothetical protein [Paractinoplanes ferrugineus]|uniref:hypothetical protein n=1 Tax=Paractinoplanes ferrugineus TaxID=113564 RepID=UPI0019421A9D|nr:hypothetical protein [Actinoplanes ferrugineus]